MPRQTRSAHEFEAFSVCGFRERAIERRYRRAVAYRKVEIGGVVGGQTVPTRQCHHLAPARLCLDADRQAFHVIEERVRFVGRDASAIMGFPNAWTGVAATGSRSPPRHWWLYIDTDQRQQIAKAEL